jgi:Carboxypeptidase regulatory-like domain
MSHRTTFILVLLFVVHACVRGKPPVVAQPASIDGTVVTTATRQVALDDSALAARQRGRLEVVVRPADRPTQPLLEAQVVVRMGQLEVRRVTDDHGLASFDSLPVGDYDVVFRRIGYGQAHAPVTIKAGCRTVAEAWIAIAMVGIAPLPPKSGRVNVTTC